MAGPEQVAATNNHAIAQEKLLKVSSILKEHSFASFTRSINLFSGYFAQWRDRTQVEPITFTDAAVAAKHIAANEVVNALIDVDSASLVDVVLACNSNSSLGKLTLRFANTISEADAKNIAQIIHRNAPHLRKLHLLHTQFENNAVEWIDHALQLNGVITDFSCATQAAQTTRRIEKTLSRNRNMRLHPVLRGIGLLLGTVFGAASGTFASLVPILPFAGTAWFVAGIIGAAAAGFILGFAIAKLVMAFVESRAQRASRELYALQRQDVANHKEVDVVMTLKQYNEAMKDVLSEKEKIEVSLRTESTQVVTAITATRTNDKVKEKLSYCFVEYQPAIKPERRITLCDGTSVTHEQITALTDDERALRQDERLTLKLTAPRIGFFAAAERIKTFAAQVRAQATDVKNVDLKEKCALAASFDDYWVVKPARGFSIS